MNERDKRIGVGLSIVDDGMRRVAISFILQWNAEI